MGSSKNKLVVVNILYWVVAMLLHPLFSLLPTPSGEAPKIYSFLIPVMFIGLAFGSTHMLWQALTSQGTGKPEGQTPPPDPSSR